MNVETVSEIIGEGSFERVYSHQLTVAETPRERSVAKTARARRAGPFRLAPQDYSTTARNGLHRAEVVVLEARFPLGVLAFEGILFLNSITSIGLRRMEARLHPWKLTASG